MHSHTADIVYSSSKLQYRDQETNYCTVHDVPKGGEQQNCAGMMSSRFISFMIHSQLFKTSNGLNSN